MQDSTNKHARLTTHASVTIGAGDSTSRKIVLRAGLPLLSFLFFIGLLYAVWEGISLTGTIPDFTLPTPLEVAQSFSAALMSGDLLRNTSVTLQEALGGFTVAALVAAIGGYTIARSRWLEVFTAPFIAASQAIPVIAIAPLIVTLLQTSIAPKIAVCALIVVFPLLITTIAGLRGVDQDYLDVARVYGASRLQMLLKVELPLAAPVLLSGVKLGLTLSITGAVVGEFVASQHGLGYMISSATANFDAPTRFAVLISLALLSITLFSLVTLAERILLRWYDA